MATASDSWIVGIQQALCKYIASAILCNIVEQSSLKKAAFILLNVSWEHYGHELKYFLKIM